MAGVFIFTAPVFRSSCKHDTRKTLKEGERATPDKRWKTTTLAFNGKTFLPHRSPVRNIEQNFDGQETEESDIILEYDPTAVQESVNLYLDTEFNGAASGSFPFELSFGFQTGPPAGFPAGNDLQSEFEAVKCASQKLLVESGAPSSSLSCDEERTGTKRKLDVEYGDAHQLTMDDIYTQLKSSSTSPSTPPSPVRKASGTKPRAIRPRPMTTRLDSEVSPTTETSCTVGNNLPLKCEARFRHPSLPRVCDKLTRLNQCTEENSLQNMVFVVLQVNDTREVQVKSGANAGSFVSLSSIVVADDSKPCFKVTLWRDASRWSEKISPGDFVVATGIKIGKWRDEFVGQTTANSGFYNFHRPKRLLSDDCLLLVSQSRLDTLVSWARTEHPYLLAGSQAKAAVKFTEIAQLRDNTLTHFRGALISIHRSQQSSSTYQFGGQRLTRITAVLAEAQNDRVQLSLWGRQATWVNHLQEGLGQVWEFQFLTAKYDRDLGCVCLHSTPRSTKTKVPPEDKHAVPILSRFSNINGAGQTRKFSTLSDLLEAKYSGLAEVEARISSLRFHCDDETITIDKIGQAANLLKGKIHKLVYVGCGLCTRPLAQDQNNVYGQCSHCVMKNPAYNYTINYYFRPLIIYLCDSLGSIKVDACNDSVSRLFRDFPAKTLALSIAHESSRDQTNFSGFFELVDSLIDRKQPQSFVIVCRTRLDENSFVEDCSFTLQSIV